MLMETEARRTIFVSLVICNILLETKTLSLKEKVSRAKNQDSFRMDSFLFCLN